MTGYEDPKAVGVQTRRTVWGRVVRGFGGSLCAGLVLLGVGMIAARLIANDHGKEGPGTGVLLWHLGAAAAALVLQRHADRNQGPPAWLAVGVICGITFAVFWFMWWG